MSLITTNDKIGIVKDSKSGKEIDIKGNSYVINAIRSFSKYGQITFSKEYYFKSTYYTIHFFKPISSLRNLYNLGNEVLILCSIDSINEFKSRTKDFLDYLLISSTEYKNRLDKITCFWIDTNENIVNIIKEDRLQNPDTRLIIPFNYDELTNGLSEQELQNRLRMFLYERDLFGIASPLVSDNMFYGKDRTNVISELYGKYKQGEQGGLFGLRRIGKTSILNLLTLRIEQEDGVAIYFDCSQFHHNRWNEFLYLIIQKLYEKYSCKDRSEDEVKLDATFNLSNTPDSYSEKTAMNSFETDIKQLYTALGKRRILLIFDEIECISYTTSPSAHWKNDLDALFFWQALRAIIQTNNSYFSFIIAGVNPQIIERGRIGDYDNPIFGSFRPIYMDLFDFDDVKRMVSEIGGHIGLHFEENVYGKLLEDYGGHPFLTRQVCSKINSELLAQEVSRPAKVTRYAYDARAAEYKAEMTGVIEQILGVLQSYYPNEFILLKKLALDGRKSFARELTNGERIIQHLCGYRLIEKDNGEYFIRIKSIEDYLKDHFIYDKNLTTQSEKRSRLNLRREKLENKLRSIVFYNLQAKYGKKAKEKLVQYIQGTTTDKTQEQKINSKKLREAMEELYFSQLKIIMLKDWKDYQNIFNDKIKFEHFFDLINQSRGAGDHGRTISDEDELMYNIAFQFFEKALIDYE